jgi:hypothetical protein
MTELRSVALFLPQKRADFVPAIRGERDQARPCQNCNVLTFEPATIRVLVRRPVEADKHLNFMM